MADNKERIIKAGDYNLDVAEILSYKIAGGVPGEVQPFRIDIQNIILSVELQQSIFSRTMIGKIQVHDTKDVRTLVPIVGLERLNLKFHTPGLTGVNATANEGHPFHIYKIESVTPDNTGALGSQVYDIFFCSRESYFNNMRKVSKAYMGQVEVGVNDIFRNRKYLSSKKNLYFEPTRNQTKIVIPNTRPFEAIDMLCKKAVSEKYENAGYLFYEDFNGYHFRSIESLLAVGGAVARPAKWSYNFGMKDVRHPSGGKEIVKDLHGAESWSLHNPVDTLDNIGNGAYANRLIEHDMFNKTIEETDFDYAEEFGKHFHTEHSDGGKSSVKTPLPYAKFDDTLKTISDEPEARVMFKSNTKNIHEHVDEKGETYIVENVSDKQTTQKALSQRQLLSTGILEIVAPGNSLIQAGDIITFDMPIMEPLGHNVKAKASPYWAGRYLVYDMKHIVDKTEDKYTVHIRAVKDNVDHPYVSEESMWSHVTQGELQSIYEADNELLGRMNQRPNPHR